MQAPRHLSTLRQPQVQEARALELQDVTISYHKPGLLDRWLRTSGPVPTVDRASLVLRKGETLGAGR